jgi:hypothetical protein
MLESMERKKDRDQRTALHQASFRKINFGKRPLCTSHGSAMTQRRISGKRPLRYGKCVEA